LKTKMNSFGVIGLGRFGMAIAQYLAEAGKDVMIVDQKEEKVQELRHLTEYAFVVERLTRQTLEEIGIQNCDTVIIGIGEKIDTSILTTLNVVALGVPRVIAKAINRDHGTILEMLGVEVVFPERDMALYMGRYLIFNGFLDFISLNNNMEIQQFSVTDSMVGISVEELDVRQKYGLNIIAIGQEHTTDIEVSPKYRFRKGDSITAIGKVENFKRLVADIES